MRQAPNSSYSLLKATSNTIHEITWSGNGQTTLYAGGMSVQNGDIVVKSGGECTLLRVTGGWWTLLVGGYMKGG